MLDIVVWLQLKDSRFTLKSIEKNFFYLLILWTTLLLTISIISMIMINESFNNKYPYYYWYMIKLSIEFACCIVIMPYLIVKAYKT